MLHFYPINSSILRHGFENVRKTKQLRRVLIGNILFYDKLEEKEIIKSRWDEFSIFKSTGLIGLISNLPESRVLALKRYNVTQSDLLDIIKFGPKIETLDILPQKCRVTLDMVQKIIGILQDGGKTGKITNLIHVTHG